MEARYRSTLWACCFANFFQAVGSCFAILYVPLRGLYGLSFTDFGILVSLNFITQVASDVLFSKPVEKYGFRPFAVAAPLVSAAGLGLFAAAPLLFPRRPFAGFCAGMFLFAAAGGLQELLLSPILDALPIPEERKARSMSMLHSFFAWGQIFVVLATTGHTQVLIHQLSRRRSQSPFRRSHGQVQRVAFHPVRPFLLVASQRSVRLYHLLRQELTKKLLPNCKWVSSLAVHPAGEGASWGRWAPGGGGAPRSPPLCLPPGDNVICGSYDSKLVWFDLDLSTKPYRVLR